MRTFAFLLLLLNLLFLFWERGLFTWFPWQANHQIQVSYDYKESDLPKLLLVGEYQVPESIKVATNQEVILSDDVVPLDNKAIDSETVNAEIADSKTVAIIFDEKVILAPDKVDKITPNFNKLITPVTEKIDIHLPDLSSKKIEIADKQPIPVDDFSTEAVTIVSKNELLNKNLTEQVVIVDSEAELASPKINYSCVQIENYTSKKAAKNGIKLLKKWAIVVTKIEAYIIKIPKLTWVYLPVVKSRKIALQIQNQLFRHGIKEHAIVTKGEFNNAISLGYYKNNFYADKRFKNIKAKGFNNVIIQKRYQDKTKYRINIKINSSKLEKLSRQIEQNFTGVKLKTGLCQDIFLTRN